MVGTVRALILLLVVACGGTEAPEAARSAPPAGARAGAVVIDAGIDAAVESEELSRSLHLLYSEHGDFWAGVEWLTAHPEESRGPLRELVQETGFSMGSKRAFIALGKIGDGRDVEVLEAVLRRGGDTYRWDAASALAAHGSREAERALIAALDDADSEIIDVAASALGMRKAEAARPKLEELSGHASASTRYRAVQALGDLGAAGSDAVLRKRARVETDGDVKKALAALGY